MFVILPVAAIAARDAQQGTSSSASGAVLAFDFGARRIGVAVGELTLRLAHPLETIEASSEPACFEQIARLIREWTPAILVVGLPAHMDGTEHAVSARCRRFAQQLQQRFGIDTRLVDERLTSQAADQSMAEAGVRAKRQKSVRDQVAAQHILETFFSER